MEKLLKIYRTKGLSGIHSHFKLLSEKNIFWKAFAFLDKKYFVIMRFLAFFEENNNFSEQNTAKKLSRAILEKLGIQYRCIPQIPTAFTNPKNGIILIGVNHPAFIEPLLLFSISDTKITNLIVNRIYYFAVKNFQYSLLPVLSRKCAKEYKVTFKERLNLALHFARSENLTEKEIVKMNTASLSAGAKLVDNGGVLEMFPGGFGNHTKKWRSGIIRLIGSIADNDAVIIPVIFEYEDDPKIISRLFKSLRGVSQNNLNVTIRFGKAIKVGQFKKQYANSNPDEAVRIFKQGILKQFGYSPPDLLNR